MKNALVVLAILCLPAFLSFTKADADKYIGEWKVFNKNREINRMEIKKAGDNYSLTYHTGQFDNSGGYQWHTENYKYKDGSLSTVEGYLRVEFIESSGHLKWNGDEWEKITH